MNRILISVTPGEVSMALVADGILQEYVLERNNEQRIVGNIFKGRVKNILKGIQAAFIDIGYSRNVFFYNGDKLDLSEGQSIIVQIVKDAMGSKGPRAVTRPALAGRYVVFLPGANYLGISKNIADPAERARLREIAVAGRPKKAGLIVRTVAAGRDAEAIQKDIRYLEGLWNSIEARSQRAKSPALLHREADLPVRAVRDYLNDGIDEIVVDDKETWQIISDLVSFSYSDYKGRIVNYRQAEPIYSHYRLDAAIDGLNARRVGLGCGGYLVFDYTEALTVIDVNTGSYKGETNLEETAFFTNLQAGKEIARQIRLRDIGGIIVIDFIDMANEGNRDKTLKNLNDALSGDRMKPRVLGITALGLVEMTRKKSRQNTAAALFAECPVCGGSGYVKSPETVAVAVRRKLAGTTGSRPLILQAHPLVAEWFTNCELQRLPRGLKIKVQAVENMHPETFAILTV
ncbi:MAG: Rne/Rng family ribonuclease [Acidaminococcales bacterium]|jgi:ribonuclease G|nr:Rne/Rng family ribonuclease [Acidaminococcales bacterium]